MQAFGRLAALAAAVGVAVAVQVPAGALEEAPARASIREQDLESDLTFIASDLFQGRLTDTPGNRLASEFVRARFQRLGLVPVASGSYFHPFQLMRTTLGGANGLVAELRGRRVAASIEEDFFPERFSASVAAAGPLVFAGFGIVAPERGHDDYRDADLRGRVVLLLDHAPGEFRDGRGADTLLASEAATALGKALAAQARGAAAVLLVRDVQNHGVGSFAAEAWGAWPRVAPRIERYMLASRAADVRIPALQVSPALAERLVAGTGRTLRDLALDAESAAGPRVRPISDVRIELSTEVVRTLVLDRNVVAALEGADPRLRDEWIVICAHLDHDGTDGSAVFDGADDNGSGVVGLLEIAEAYALAAAAGRRPRRSVLFAAWNSEERGLLGASAYVERPLVPLDRTVAVLNMDMIGRNEEVPAGGGSRFQGLAPQTAESNANAVNLLGYSYAPEVSDLVTRANATLGLDLRRRYDENASNLIRRSDQWPFLERGVPALWFFTGLHPDYHTPEDRADRINYPKMARVVRLVYETSWLLADADGRPRFVSPSAP